MPLTSGRRTCLAVVVTCWLYGDLGSASRPDVSKFSSQEALHDRRGHKIGRRASGATELVSFHDFVRLNQAPEISSPAQAACEEFTKQHFHANADPADFCPGGHCQVDVLVGQEVDNFAVERNRGVLRVSLTGRRKLSEATGIQFDKAQLHPQLFVDNSNGCPWGYVLIPGSATESCEWPQLLRTDLLSADDFKITESIDVDPAGSGDGTVDTAKTSTGQSVLTENAEGTRLHFDLEGGLQADAWRTSEKSGCEDLDEGCDGFFAVPANTKIHDITKEEFMRVLVTGKFDDLVSCAQDDSAALVQVLDGTVMKKDDGGKARNVAIGFGIAALVVAGAALCIFATGGACVAALVAR